MKGNLLRVIDLNVNIVYITCHCIKKLNTQNITFIGALFKFIGLDPSIRIRYNINNYWRWRVS